MPENTRIINLESVRKSLEPAKQELCLESGRKIVVCSDENEELFEVISPSGEIIVKMRFTDTGPVLVAEGARLELKSPESIELEAKRVEIRARESASVQSRGNLEISSAEEMNVHSEDDVRISAKMLHLN
ncbi:MAG: hypothetical protein GY795_09515 [Desulfobacterales bacterium]|nr:hypothetical protein [Desulfobacterales bacterium]